MAGTVGKISVVSLSKETKHETSENVRQNSKHFFGANLGTFNRSAFPYPSDSAMLKSSDGESLRRSLIATAMPIRCPQISLNGFWPWRSIFSNLFRLFGMFQWRGSQNFKQRM